MGQFKILVFAWCNATRNYLGILVDCPASCTQQILHHVVQLQPQSFRFVDKGLFGDFFSAYVDALADGHHDIDNGVICMMPNCGPNTSTSVSHGIRTTVSVMFCSDETSRFRVYRYQVTFEIVDPEELGFDSVQLKDRHWLVHYSDEQLAQSGGPGVIGQLPVLSRESPYYRYCSRMQDEEGGPAVVAFEGHFTMVPGTLEEPLGQDMILFVPYVEVPMPLESMSQRPLNRDSDPKRVRFAPGSSSRPQQTPKANVSFYGNDIPVSALNDEYSEYSDDNDALEADITSSRRRARRVNMDGYNSDASDQDE
ncbi:hypothetical protein GGF37_007286, partial [Kickxella alabastrina]